MESRYDVIVIGGGLSGLSAATLLKSSSLNVIVLEANCRLGGRVHTIHNEDVGAIDLGGTYVGPTQDRILRIARQLGVNTQFVLNNGDMTCYRKGELRRFHGILPPMGGVTAMLDASHVLRTMHQLCEQIPLDKPWLAEKASELDSITFQEFLDRTVTSNKVKDNQKMLVRLNMTAEPYELSLLWTLWYIKGAGGIYRMNAFEGGAQERTFVGGAQQIVDKMAANLPGKVFVNKPVVRIHQDHDHVTVFTSNGEVFESNYVVLATPPTAQMKMIFEPALPMARHQLIQRVPLGSVIKCFCFYQKSYWNLKGLSGTTFVEDDDPEFPVVATIDFTRQDGTYPCILGFIAGEKARLLASLTKEQRQAKVVQQYAKVFQSDEMLSPTVYVEKNWSEDVWSGGCYTGYMAPRVMTSFGRALREPQGRLYFAGTETATVWSGYMDGAVQAGERAAKEILYELGRCDKDEIYALEMSEDTARNHQFEPGFSEKYLPSKPSLIRSVAVLGTLAAAGALGGKLARSKL
jgi:monoamine oxidase